MGIPFRESDSTKCFFCRISKVLNTVVRHVLHTILQYSKCGCTSDKYCVIKTLWGKFILIRLIISILFDTCCLTIDIWSFYVNDWFIITPRNLIEVSWIISVSLIFFFECGCNLAVLLLHLRHPAQLHFINALLFTYLLTSYICLYWKVQRHVVISYKASAAGALPKTSTGGSYHPRCPPFWE